MPQRFQRLRNSTTLRMAAITQARYAPSSRSSPERRKILFRFAAKRKTKITASGATVSAANCQVERAALERHHKASDATGVQVCVASVREFQRSDTGIAPSG